jgi:hypothetical protein
MAAASRHPSLMMTKVHASAQRAASKGRKKESSYGY